MVVDPWIGSSIIRIMSERFSHLDHFPPQETKKERSQRQRKIRKLATKFREELRNSQSFTWFGMYETQDELDRTRRVFMVAEKPENPAIPCAAGRQGRRVPCRTWMNGLCQPDLHCPATPR